ESAPARTPPCGLEAGTPDEAGGDEWQTVGDLHRQRRQATRRRTIQNASTRPKVELREMTRALHRARRGLPVPRITAGVRAHRRVSHDAAGRARAGVAVERTRIETHDQALIEARVVADDAGAWIHRIRGQRRPAWRQVRQRDDATFALAGRVREAIVGLGPRAARGVVLRGDETGERQASAHT